MLYCKSPILFLSLFYYIYCGSSKAMFLSLPFAFQIPGKNFLPVNNSHLYFQSLVSDSTPEISLYWIAATKFNEFFIFNIVPPHETYLIRHELLFCFYQTISYLSLLVSLYCVNRARVNDISFPRIPFIVYFIKMGHKSDILEIRR